MAINRSLAKIGSRPPGVTLENWMSDFREENSQLPSAGSHELPGSTTYLKALSAECLLFSNCSHGRLGKLLNKTHGNIILKSVYAYNAVLCIQCTSDTLSTSIAATIYQLYIII